MGSVDRKTGIMIILTAQIKSLPAWGAWIERNKGDILMGAKNVAPRMGSVDRKLTFP